MSRERASSNRVLDDSGYIEECEPVPGCGRVDDQKVVDRTARSIGLLFQMPYFPEDDELSPARRGLEQLPKAR